MRMVLDRFVRPMARIVLDDSGDLEVLKHYTYIEPFCELRRPLEFSFTAQRAAIAQDMYRSQVATNRVQ